MVSCSRCGEAGEDGNANLNHVARPGKSQEEPPRKTTVDSSQGLEAGVQSRGSELGPLHSALALSLPQDMHSFSSLSALFLLLSPQTNNLSFSFSTLTSTTTWHRARIYWAKQSQYSLGREFLPDHHVDRTWSRYLAWSNQLRAGRWGSQGELFSSLWGGSVGFLRSGLPHSSARSRPTIFRGSDIWDLMVPFQPFSSLLTLVPSLGTLSSRDSNPCYSALPSHLCFL